MIDIDSASLGKPRMLTLNRRAERLQVHRRGSTSNVQVTVPVTANDGWAAVGLPPP
jgi:hypothetical protein